MEALERICSEPYDALLTNLHLSRARDGLLIVNELRRVNPSAVILLLSAFPQLETAAQAILLRADEIVARPTDTASLIDVLTNRIAIWACLQSSDRERWRNSRSDNRSSDRGMV